MREKLPQPAQDRERAALRASQDELRRIADEQAALRHLATLVAHEVSPVEVFDAIAREMGRILGTEHNVIGRYEPDGKTITWVGGWNYLPQLGMHGSQQSLEKGTVSELVARTGAPGRINGYAGPGPLSTALRNSGIRCSVGCPITVGQRLWGVAIALSSTSEPLPADTEERMAGFTELAATAIANAQARTDLRASRARVVVTADETRRRIERDLHDGAQQRLIYVCLKLREIESIVPQGLEELRSKLTDVSRVVDETVAEVQQIARGLHPAHLAKGGLSQALSVLARRCAVTVDLKVSLDRRLPERLEVTVYYIVSEALTNVAKHAHASNVSVDLTISERMIQLSVRDNGVGGADSAGGSGLIGLVDRVNSLGGKLDISSPPRQGTTLLALIPAEEAVDELAIIDSASPGRSQNKSPRSSPT